MQGSCEVVKKNKSKSQKQLATLEAGAVFGEMSFFAKAPHSATVRALTAVKVMRLTRENFEVLQTTVPRRRLQNRRQRAGRHGPAAPPDGRLDLRFRRALGRGQSSRRMA